MPRLPPESEFLDPRDERILYPQRVAASKVGMAATAHYEATAAAEEILAAGGNAFDAAVAAAFALGVCEPAASGLGGQTMVLLYDAKSRRKVALDGGTRAPNRIIPGVQERYQTLRGHRATTVPSTPAVLLHLLNRYGSKTMPEVLAPSIRLARAGYRMSPLQHYLAKREVKHLREHSAGKLFLREGRTPYLVGHIFKQPVLADTLQRLSDAGIEDFYQGEIAARIVADMEANDGLLHADDLARIPWPVERRPLATHFNGWRVFTFGPPGAGRTLIEALNLLDQFSEAQRNPDIPKGALLLAEVIRKANMDRADRPDDPNLFPQELEEDITRPEYAEKAAKRIRSRLRRVKTNGETTHLSVMDAAGNAVALTQSIERVYGSFSAAPDLGFLYNNYMSAFDVRDIAHPYYLRPNAVPWASVAPTLIFRGNKPWLSIGSPGSERIVSAILQVLLRLERGATPFDAVEAPRLHASVRGKVSLEASRMRNDIPPLLEKHGFEIDRRDPYSFYLGCVQLVLRGRYGELMGVADPRRDGSAGGPT